MDMSIREELEEKLKIQLNHRKFLVNKVENLQFLLSANKNKINNIKSSLHVLDFSNSTVPEKAKKVVSFPNIIISEHALLRYIKRVRHVDVDGIKQYIIRCVEKHNKEFGHSGEIEIGNCVVVLKKNVVITVKYNKSIKQSNQLSIMENNQNRDAGSNEQQQEVQQNVEQTNNEAVATPVAQEEVIPDEVVAETSTEVQS